MTIEDHVPPERGGEFPELNIAFEDDLEGEILKVVIDALNRQGYPDLNPESLETNDEHRAAAVEMLKDCRPLPVILSLIDRIESRTL
jgi:hypothetical protein